MATINSKRIIQQMIENNGVYRGDPQALAIYEYHDCFGGGNAVWAVCYDESDREVVLSSPYVPNPRLIWSRESRVSKKGNTMEEFLENLGQLLFSRSRKSSRENSTCVSCDGNATEFRDELSRKEYGISGFCQRCQDEVFKGEE